MLTEVIIWHDTNERLPDADLTVMVETRGCEEPVWLGHLDGEQWRDVDGLPIDVVRWADMPRGGGEGGAKECPTCRGFGRVLGTGDTPCKDCKGSGTSDGVPGTFEGGGGQGKEGAC